MSSLSRFPFLHLPLQPLANIVGPSPLQRDGKLKSHLSKALYSVRLLRYWWAGQCLKREAERLGRPLCVVDLGCERGWLKHFTPEGAVEKWIGLDWNPRPEVSKAAAYDEVHHANFDERLPLESGVADAVVSLHVFEHLPRPGATMAEVARLLKPDGVFLGGAPTMPHRMARVRERYFRKLLAAGQLAVGGHITVLSPTRWCALAEDAGLNVEFATGSHLMRLTGSGLENSRLWVRLNQLWGAIFPSLGSECYVMARRAKPWSSASERLAPEDPHWRKLWIGLAGAAVLSLLAVVWWALQWHDNKVSHWVSAHQTGGDVFVAFHPGLHRLHGTRSDLHFAESHEHLYDLMKQHPHAHVVVSEDNLEHVSAYSNGDSWHVDSRLTMLAKDYLMLKRSSGGTPLSEYLRGNQQPL